MCPFHHPSSVSPSARASAAPTSESRKRSFSDVDVESLAPWPSGEWEIPTELVDDSDFVFPETCFAVKDTDGGGSGGGDASAAGSAAAAATPAAAAPASTAGFVKVSTSDSNIIQMNGKPDKTPLFTKP